MQSRPRPRPMTQKEFFNLVVGDKVPVLYGYRKKKLEATIRHVDVHLKSVIIGLSNPDNNSRPNIELTLTSPFTHRHQRVSDGNYIQRFFLMTPDKYKKYREELDLSEKQQDMLDKIRHLGRNPKIGTEELKHVILFMEKAIASN